VHLLLGNSAAMPPALVVTHSPHADTCGYGPPPHTVPWQVGADAVAGVRPGMPCTTCLHPTCRHSPARQGVMPCPECGAGVLVLDPTSGPKWRLDCSRCSCLIYLPQALHEAKVTKEACEVRRCGVEWSGVEWIG
jgi:hypothetical protein